MRRECLQISLLAAIACLAGLLALFGGGCARDEAPRPRAEGPGAACPSNCSPFACSEHGCSGFVLANGVDFPWRARNLGRFRDRWPAMFECLDRKFDEHWMAEDYGRASPYRSALASFGVRNNGQVKLSGEVSGLDCPSVPEALAEVEGMQAEAWAEIGHGG